MKPGLKIILEALGGIICIMVAWAWLVLLAGFID